MPRIRTIKPEFWDSPSTAKAGPWARLLFIALWNWADDYGRGTANLKELEGFAFPNDDTFTDRSGNTVHFRSLVAEVSECFGVVFYTVNGRPFYAIPTWDEHQRNERRSKESKFPSPQVKDAVAEIPCNRTETPRTSGPGTGEQGNRGTRETTTFNAAGAAVEHEDEPGSSEPVNRYPKEFEDFWAVYPRRQKKGDALRTWQRAKKRATPSTILAGAQRLRDDPNRVDQFTPLAATWLNGDGWEDEPLPPRHASGGNVVNFEAQKINANNELTRKYMEGVEDPWSNVQPTRQLPRS